ncbi:MAG TPA: hypothetical protein VIN10_14560 [Bacteroidales bacterium]
MKKIMYLNFLILGMIFIFVSCSQKSKKAYDIVKDTEGYIITVPERVLEGLRDGQIAMITLDAGEKGISFASGKCKRVAPDKLKFITPEEVNLYLIEHDETWLLINGVVGNSNDGTNCSGCPRKDNLQVYDNKENMCWCWTE